MDQLWAPWRMEYVKSPKQKDGCVLCEKLDSDDLVVFRGQDCFVVMNLYPYNNAHVLICPYKHQSEFTDLSNETQSEIMTISSQLMKFMKSDMNAEGFNIGANIGKAAGAGIDEHFHFHIVPRWNGDTNFMPVVGHTKVQVENLQDCCNQLKKAFNNPK